MRRCWPQTLADPHSDADQPIGSHYAEADADVWRPRKVGWCTGRRSFRRVVASGRVASSTSVRSHCSWTPASSVMCAGGGGISVVEDGGGLRRGGGRSLTRTSQRRCWLTGATRTPLLVADVFAVELDRGLPTTHPLRRMTPAGPCRHVLAAGPSPVGWPDRCPARVRARAGRLGRRGWAACRDAPEDPGAVVSVSMLIEPP